MSTELFEREGMSVVAFARPGQIDVLFYAPGVVLDRDDVRALVVALTAYLEEAEG